MMNTKTKNKQPVSVISQIYKHTSRPSNIDQHFTVEQLSTELKQPASAIRRSLSRSLNNYSEMYPGLNAYDDGTYMFTSDRSRKTVIKGNTQTETFDVETPENQTKVASWQAGAMLEVLGMIGTGQLAVRYEGEIHLATLTSLENVVKNQAF